jgi:hypothetical protein
MNNEQLLDTDFAESTHQGKIFDKTHIVVATFVGGTLSAVYMIAQNYKAFGDAKNQKNTWIFGLLATIALWIFIYIIPETSKIPMPVIPLMTIGLVRYFINSNQIDNITAHINEKGGVFGWGRTIGVAVVSLLITLVVLMAFSYFFDVPETVE